jgi:hypothetical protein
MQRIYIFVVIAAIVFAISYSDTIRDFFSSPGTRENTSPIRQESAEQDDAYEQLRIDLYRTATTLSDLQGKVQILEMAKEKREWFRDEEYENLAALIEETEKELEVAKSAYEQTKEEFTRITVQMMLKTFSEQQ